jgi:hypothetical protein
MKTIKVDLELEHITENPLTLKIFIDQTQYPVDFPAPRKLSFDFEYDDTNVCKHEFKIYVSGKRNTINTNNDTNAAIEIKNIHFNGFNIVPMIKGTYSHNSNGFGNEIKEDFTTFLGCDGLLEFDFYSPLSMWVIKQYPY